MTVMVLLTVLTATALIVLSAPTHHATPIWTGKPAKLEVVLGTTGIRCANNSTHLKIVKIVKYNQGRSKPDAPLVFFGFSFHVKGLGN